MAALPGELIDTIALVRPARRVRERLARLPRRRGRHARRLAHGLRRSEDRLEQLRHVAELARPALRVLLGAFGDPGHAFPMHRARARLRRARARRGAADVGALAGRRRARGDDASPPRRSTRCSRRRAAAEALRGGERAPRRHAPLVREFAPGRRASRTSSRSAPALAAELEGVPVATLVPHVYPAPRPASRRTRSARGCRARALGRARCGGARTALCAAGSSAGARELNGRARAARPAAARPRCTAGISRSLALVGDVAAARVPAARGRPWMRVVGPLLWEPPGERGRAAARRRPGRARRAVDRAGRGGHAAARGARRAGARARARDRHVQRPAAPRGSRCRPTRCSSTGSPTRGRCPAATSWSATAGTGRSCAR